MRTIRTTIQLSKGVLGVAAFLLLCAGAFAQAPAQATNPFPADGAVAIPTDVVLTWQDGGSGAAAATTYHVNLWTDTSYATPPNPVYSGPETYYDCSVNPTPLTSPLLPGTTYYWRVDSENGSGTTTGLDWSFTTAGGNADRYAVIVGLDNYGYTGPAPLTTAVNDASATMNTIFLADPGARWNADNMQLLTDAGATNSAIRTAIQDLVLVTSGTASLVVFYYSGQTGSVSGSVATYDADYLADDLAADLALFTSSVHIVVILDSDDAASMLPATVIGSGNNIAYMVSSGVGHPNARLATHGAYTDGLIRSCFDQDFCNIYREVPAEAQFYELHFGAARYLKAIHVSGGQVPQTLNDYILRLEIARAYSDDLPVLVPVPLQVQASDGAYTNGVLVTWYGVWAPGGEGNYYQVSRAETETGTKVPVSDWLPTADWVHTRSYMDRSAEPQKIYYYFVQASNYSDGSNVSGYSEPDTGWRDLNSKQYVDLSNGLPLPTITEMDAASYQVTSDPLLRTGVPWAVGYYYMSYQMNKAQGTLPDAVARMISPYFVFDNGGAYVLSDAFQLLKGTGACTLDVYGTSGLPSSPDQYVAAALNKACGAGTFFPARPVKVQDQMLVSRNANNVNALRAWLQSGDCFVLGIPVFQSFLDYTGGMSRADVYNPDPSREYLLGFHAVCVAGYDDSKGAFLAVNSFGPIGSSGGSDWGTSRPHDTTMRGYCWLGYNFVKACGQEVWRMGYSTGRVTEQYDVTYNGALYDIYLPPPPGIAFTDAQGLVISDLSPTGQLKIKFKKGVYFGDALPQVTSNGGLAKVYTDAPIAQLNTAGAVGSLVARNCVVSQLKADGGLGAVSMSSTANTLWASVAQSRVQASPRAFTFNELRDNPIYSAVQSSSAINTRLSLLGVQMVGLNLPTSNLSVSLATKKNKMGTLPYLSVAGMTSGTVTAGILRQVKIQGGDFGSPTVLSTGGDIASISASRLPFTDVGGGMFGTLGGSVTLGTLYAKGNIGSIQAIGGDLTGGTIMADLDIRSLAARLVNLRLAKQVFAAGGNFNVGQVVAGLQGGIDANILSVFGSVGINGQFIAGAQPDLTPTKYGYVGTLGTQVKMPAGSAQLYPLITGASWSSRAVHFVGGDPRTFVQH